VLHVSLVLTAILLIAAHAAARADPQPVRYRSYLGWGFAVAVLPFCFVAVFPSVFVLYLALGVALAAWHLNRRRVRVFFPYSLAAVLVVYGGTFWFLWQGYSQLVALRDRFPLESMAERVPEPEHRATGVREESLERFETEVLTGRFTRRSYLFDRLHRETLERFANSSGFGVARMVTPRPTDRNLSEPLDRADPPPQPESSGPAWELGDVQFKLPEHDRTAAHQLHTAGLINFVNPDGWGYVRSRREVAGFLPHAFSRVPTGREWKVVRVELVGLLKHPEPVVYPSDRLPAMADLKDAPTRPPDAFETAGVAAIRKGDDGFGGRRGDEVRYVGAVRSAEACVKCHGGERGDLLGAFSYRLRPAGVP
jgi:hypothetical protein